MNPPRPPGAPRHPTATLAAGAVLISFAPVFVRIAPVGPGAAGFYRVAIGGVALALIAAARGRRFPGWGHVAGALAAGVLLALDLVWWHASIRDVGPGLATILANFQVFALAAVGVLWFREPLRARVVVAAPLAIVGLVLLVGIDWDTLQSAARRGVVLGLLAAAAYAGFLLVLRSVQRRPGADAATTLALVCFCAAAVLAPAGLREPGGLAIPNAAGGAILIAYALGAQVIAWLVIAHALPHVPAGTIGLVLLLQPALAFIWDMVFFGRPTDLADVVGAALALGAIYLGTRAQG